MEKFKTQFKHKTLSFVDLNKNIVVVILLENMTFL